MNPSFIQRELDRIESLLHAAPLNSDRYRQLFVARQALSWALEPNGFGSPSDTILGTVTTSVSIPPE